MKELGEELNEARLEMGLSLEEVSMDLNIDVTLLENLEAGNNRAFRDILELKQIIAAYYKYLGLDQEKILDEFSDYVFASTSKISVEDIKEAAKKNAEENTKKIYSPYTKEEKNKPSRTVIIMSISLVSAILVILYFLLKAKIIG